MDPRDEENANQSEPARGGSNDFGAWREARSQLAKRAGKKLFTNAGKMAAKQGAKRAAQAGLAATGVGLIGTAAIELASNEKLRRLIIIIALCVIGTILVIFLFFFRGKGPSDFEEPPPTTGGQTATGSAGLVPGLTLNKTGPSQVDNGQQISYTVSATYTGNQDVSLIDNIPLKTRFVRATGKFVCDDPNCSSNTKRVVWLLKDNTATESATTITPGVSPNKPAPFSKPEPGYGRPLQRISVTQEQIQLFFEKRRSPYASMLTSTGKSISQAVYEAGVKHNVDPAFILASWAYEHGFNNLPLYKNNPGSIICAFDPAVRAEYKAKLTGMMDTCYPNYSREWAQFDTIEHGIEAIAAEIRYFFYPLGQTDTWLVHSGISTDPATNHAKHGWQDIGAQFGGDVKNWSDYVAFHDKWIAIMDEVAGGAGGTIVTKNYSFELVIEPLENDILVINRIEGGLPLPGGGIIDSSSTSLDQILNDAASSANVPVALLKAIAKTESRVLTFSNEDVTTFSQIGWWEGRPDTDPLIRRGYAYNTCENPALRCAPGADVRGVMQFELGTWNGLKGQLRFADAHDPDRRNLKDNIFGAARHIRNIADTYKSQYNFSDDPNQWGERQVKAISTAYCAGRPDANLNNAACSNTQGTHADIAWHYYQEFRAAQQSL